MDREFWLERWRNQQIGFHLDKVNPTLVRHWGDLAAPDGCEVFVPLCGKSRDLTWLAAEGHEVIGVELAEAAVRAFFEEAGLPCLPQRVTHHLRFAGGRVQIYCGDFMDLIGLYLHRVKAVYDRAALVALPPKMRATYADHLLRIVPDGCRILLVTLEYDQSRVAGPPHSVCPDEVKRLFGKRCRIELLARAPAVLLPPKFADAGIDDAEEAVYLLIKKS